MRVTRATAAIAAIMLLFGISACGSSSKSSNNSSTGTTADCPFSGSTSQQKAGSATSNTTKLQQIQPSRSGCIDNLAFNFSPSLAPATGAYNGSAAGNTLVISLSNASNEAGSSIDTSKLEYVKSIAVASSGTGTAVTITLDKQRPFLMSSSNVPASLQVSIG